MSTFGDKRSCYSSPDYNQRFISVAGYAEKMDNTWSDDTRCYEYVTIPIPILYEPFRDEILQDIFMRSMLPTNLSES